MKTILGNLLALLLLFGVSSQSHATTDTTYSVDEHNTMQQTGPSSFVVGSPLYNYKQFALFAKIDTDGASLSATPVLNLPGGGTISFPQGVMTEPTHPTGAGYNRYQQSVSATSISALNAIVSSGTFSLTMGDATESPTLPLDTVSPTFPPAPALTSGGNWIGSSILINPAGSTTLNFNTSDFTTYTTGMGGQITYQIYDPNISPIVPATVSQYIPALGKTDAALSSYTIPPGILTPGVTYGLEANYYEIEAENTTSFTGTGIAGNPFGASFYTARTMIALVADPLSGTLKNNGIYNSPWFGHYQYEPYPLVYSYNLGYEYLFPAAPGLYLYDYATGMIITQ